MFALFNIMSIPLASGIDTCSTLLTKEARKKWEKCFNDTYVQPILIVRGIPHFIMNIIIL